MVEKIKKTKAPIIKKLKTISKIKKTPKKKTVGKLKVIKKSSATKNDKIQIAKKITLKRSYNNPILKPSHYPNWESGATFNPSAIYHDGHIHIVYRAIGIGDTSVLGYAKTKDGLHITERLSMPIYKHSTNKNKSLKKLDYISGGGGDGGCEDPRMTLIEDNIYMMYTAFDGWGSVRIGMTHIKVKDFVNKNFNWKEPVLISMPGEVQKNWVLFPEKINGKYAIIHAISPEIMIYYSDNLNEFNGKTFIHSIHQDHPLWKMRDRNMRGIGPAPIKTKYGWLVIYHTNNQKDSSKYNLHAMLLDKKDPTLILHKSKDPILEPEEHYENEGKPGIVYSCGAVVKDKELFIYYGGGDMVTCVAKANLDLFLEELMHDKALKLTTKIKTKK
ncbi:MAG: hypothetical protein NTX85_01415 [Candidatus Nomurabacteria bacterium]|nr:hypothetical protein [Candidatus Nomurabacteria bacterium]